MISGQFLATSADLTPSSGLSKGILPRVIQIQNSEMILETNNYQDNQATNLLNVKPLN